MSVLPFLNDSVSFSSLALCEEIVQALDSLSISCPTEIQLELFNISASNKTKHFVIESPRKSGKTLAGLVFAAHSLTQAIQPSYFAVLTSSKSKCITNLQTFHALLQNVHTKKILGKVLADENLSDLNLNPSTSYALISTPMKFLTFLRNSQIPLQNYLGIFVDDADFCFSFGFKEEIASILNTFGKESLASKFILLTGVSLLEEDSETQNLKQQFLKNSATLKIEDEEMEEELPKDPLNMPPHYYFVGGELEKFIVIYILTKLKFITGKSLILCKDVEECFKLKLFLERCNVKGASVYNKKNPKAVKAYTISNFNTGLTSTLISTKEILKEGREIAKKQRDKQFKGVSNVIMFSAVLSPKEIFSLYEHITSQFGCIVGLYGGEEVENLSELFEEEKLLQNSLGLKELPLRQTEVAAFNYRIKDVLAAISRKQLKAIQCVEFQKIILKAKSLNSHFSANPVDKEFVTSSIVKKQNFLNRFAVRLYEDVPEYLLPNAVKEKRKSESSQKRFIEIGKRESDNLVEGLKKRAEGNGLTLDDIKKDVTRNRAKGVFKLDLQKEDPLVTDAQDLLPVSSRKLWKIKHGKRLKKRNLRLEKKGIFS